jgi:hypothetical protein
MTRTAVLMDHSDTSKGIFGAEPHLLCYEPYPRILFNVVVHLRSSSPNLQYVPRVCMNIACILTWVMNAAVNYNVCSSLKHAHAPDHQVFTHIETDQLCGSRRGPLRDIHG